MASLKEISARRNYLAGGHRMCAGCGIPIVVKLVVNASPDPVVVVSATGCLEVTTSIFPYSAWRVPWFHSAFENSAATASGIETAIRVLEKRGKLLGKINVLVISGDGGTYDIGLQSLSGALERGHRFVYVCYNNEAYMNTGIQRSSATPPGAHTTTTPAGSLIPGKIQPRKKLTDIVSAHPIPYAAQSSMGNWKDLFTKAEKAFKVEGPAFLNVYTSCVPGWDYPEDQSVEVARLASDTCFWPLYEIENGRLRITYRPKEKKPVEEFLKIQRRFRHLFSEKNRHIIEKIQKMVDEEWERLLALDASGLRIF